MTSTDQPGTWVEAWLSEPRFDVYLAAADGDRRLALNLYEWNTLTSTAFQRDLAHLEVGLRNAYDAAIVANTPADWLHWTTDPYRLFPTRWRRARDGTRIDESYKPRQQIERAVYAAGADASPGKVLAELPFGFWRYMSSTAHHDHLWIPYLHAAFAAGTDRRDVDKPVSRLHRLRNRIAHHEPLLVRDPETRVLSLQVGHLRDRHTDLLTVTGLISQELHDHLDTGSTVLAQLHHRPG